MNYLPYDMPFLRRASHLMWKMGFRRMAALILTLIFSLIAAPARSQTAHARSVIAKETSTVPLVIVIGFVGGFINRNNPSHAEVQLAARLRKDYSSGVDIETFENRSGEEARKQILALLDTDHDGDLTAREKKNARIILYGHSWGGAQAVVLARKLEKDGVPVLLTIQVDSVAGKRQNDALIPANVVQAANFFQPDGRLHGQPEIRAADPARTKIIGNFRFDYKSSAYNCKGYPWYDRIFGKSHTQIECDPVVWERVESLIRADLPPAVASGPEH